MSNRQCILVDRKQLLELYISRTIIEVEPRVYVYIANASFAATSGRGIAAPFSFIAFRSSRHQVILARERMSQDNVSTVSFSVLSSRGLTVR